jgi:hypothetical protein
MAGGTRIEEYPAPVGGMEWRKGYQEKKHAQLLVNVDLSRGTLRSREGFEWMAAAPLNGRLHVTEDPHGRKLILAVGAYHHTDYTVRLYIYDEWGGILATQNLTADFGEPPQRWVRCSFVNTQMADSDNNARYITLICTKHNTYVYDPYTDDSQARVMAMDERPAGDQHRSSKDAYGYMLTTPRGGIMEEHTGRVFYAGFAKSQRLDFSKAIEDDQNGIREIYIGADRMHLVVGPHVVFYSSGYDGVADVLDLNLFWTDNNERITGLKSFQEALTIFTDQSIYVTSGIISPFAEHQFGMSRVDHGHGCAAHNSIIEVGGVLYYMSHGGVYAYGGLAAPQAIKISSPIDALWQGSPSDVWIPEEMNALMVEELGWPWQIDHKRLEECNVMHAPHLNQIWWSVPIKGKTRLFQFGLTLVFDYVRAAWTVFASRDHGASDFNPMADGVLIDSSGAPRIYTTNSILLQRYGSHQDKSQAAQRGIPMVWLTPPLNSSGASNERVKDVRFHLLSFGLNRGDGAARVVISGEDSHMDMQRDTREEKAADLKLHPNDQLEDFFLGDMILDTGGKSFFAERDWFLSKFNARVSSPSWRVGILDDADEVDRAQVVEMKNFVAEIKTLSTE